MIERTSVSNSSSIKSHGYDPETGTLHVEFTSGKVGIYTGVPAAKAQGLADTCVDPKQSAGTFFSREIRNGCTFGGYVGDEENG